MLLNKVAVFILCIIFPVLKGIGQDNFSKAITIRELQDHLAVIASDSMVGRNLEKISGLEMAAVYLSQNAKELKLNPFGESYFQSFKIISSKPTENNDSIIIIDNQGRLLYKSGSIAGIRHDSDYTKMDGELVFAGFGWQDIKQGYDDLKGIDLKNKIVICSVGLPDSFKNKKSFKWERKTEFEKIRRLFEKGAKAVIFIISPKERKANTFHRIRRSLERTIYYNDESILEDKLAAVALPEVADAILGGKNKYKNYLNKVAKKMKSNSFDLKNAVAQININRKIGNFYGKNIVGIIEGSDPILKNECVVYMAHYDHLGVNKHNEVYNGADDNGSGTAALLELAEAFSISEIKPKRSVVFVWVTGEEIGLLGSKYYSRHPAFPLKKTVACINLDMVGRVFEPRDSVWNKSPKVVKDFDGIYTLVSNFSPQLKILTDSVCSVLGLIPDHSLPDNFFHSSDQHHFHKNGVPILNLSTGYHADYHKTSDDVSKINFEKMKRVADLAFLVGYEMANKDYNHKTDTKIKNNEDSNTGRIHRKYR